LICVRPSDECSGCAAALVSIGGCSVTRCGSALLDASAMHFARRRQPRPCNRLSRSSSGDRSSEETSPAQEPLILGVPPPRAEASEATGSSMTGAVPLARVPLARVAPRKFKILFTCKVCDHKNSYMISRLAYYQGIVIALCPGCQNRHLLADKLSLLDCGVFDVEMLAQQGESVMRLGANGFRPVDGTVGRPLAIPPPETAGGTREVPGRLVESALNSGLLVRRKDGLVEAVCEEEVGLSKAAEFLAEDMYEGALEGADASLS